MMADAIIIGGGLIGMSIAWRLAQKGLRVSVVDAGRLGGEASWAGAGMLAPGGEFDAPGEWTDFAVRSLRMYADFIAELNEETGTKIDFRQCGAIEAAFDEKEWRVLTARARAQQSAGITTSQIDGREARTIAHGLSKHVQNALVYGDDAVVNPRDLIRALRAACGARGVKLMESLRVDSIDAGETVLIACAGNRLEAGMCVVAAGAWSSDLMVCAADRERKLPACVPIKGHLIGFALEPESVGPILRHGHSYILQRAGGFTIVGGSTERAGFDRSVDGAVAHDIAARAALLLPRLAQAGYETWVGFRPATESGHPEIGRFGDSRVWLAYGHYRNGILLAPATAERIVGEMAG